MNKLISALVVLIATSAQAQSVTLREDMRDGRKPSLTFGLAGSGGLRLWGLNANKAPTWELGMVTPQPIKITSNLSVTAGGFASYWQGEKRVYLEPWSYTRLQVGRWSVAAKLSAYLPWLGGGSWKLFSDRTECLYRVTPRWSLGLAAGDAWLVSGKKPRIGVGPTLTGRLGTVSVTGRLLYGVNEPNSLRVETTLPF